MKFAFVLFALVFSSTVIAKDLTVLVVDGWKSKPVVNCEVTLKSSKNKVEIVGFTDDQGRVVFSGLSKGVYTVFVDDFGDDFSANASTMKLKKDTETMLVLPAKSAYRLKQMAIEDSIYGKYEPPKKDSLQGVDSVLQASHNDVYVESEFPGGVAGFQLFVEKTVVYPDISRELGDQGRVYVSFIVETDGVVTHVRIFRSLTRELDEEAMRLVRSMPNWTPCTLNGEKIRGYCRLPITFGLN